MILSNEVRHEDLYDELSRIAPTVFAADVGDTWKENFLLDAEALGQEVRAQELLAEDWGVSAGVWSATSFTELAREGMGAERWNLLHPGEEPRVPYVTSVLPDTPAVAASDYMRTFAEQIRPYVPGPYTVLGTDGFGRSDWRRSLREFFEVDRRYVAIAALRHVDPKKAAEAVAKYEINAEAEAPWRR